MKHAVSLGFALAAFFAAPIAAEATLITQSRSFDRLSFTSITGPADSVLVADFAFQPFDAAQGTLQSVEFQIDGLASFFGSYTCTLRDCSNVFAVERLTLSFSGSGFNEVTQLAEPLLDQLPLGSTGGGGLSLVGGGFSIAVHEQRFQIPLFTDLSQFLQGPFTIDLQATAQYDAISGLLNQRLDRHEFRGSATLSYIFEQVPDVVPIPAPASLPLFAAGLAALGFAGRFRHRP